MGADVVVRTGPHEILGIEIYKDKPIFYGMGSIFYGVGINGKRRFGSGMYQFAIEDTWFDSAVAFTKFKNGKMSEIRIYPLTVVMGSGPMASSMRLAAGADAQRILTRLQQDSAPFGTSIDIEKGVGIIRGSKP